MSRETHPNQAQSYALSRKELEQLFARTSEQLVDQKASRDRAGQWPGLVEQALFSLAQEIVALRTRIDAVEATVGNGQG